MPWSFRFLGVILVFVVIIFITQKLPENISVPIAILTSMLMPAIWFSKSILIIDNVSKEIHEAIWILGAKTGKPRKFGEIEKIYINRVNTSRRMYSRANLGYDIRGLEFHAYLKLDDGEKIFLASAKDEKKLEEKVMKIRQKLGIS